MLIIERFEGDRAIIEDGDRYFETDRDLLPENAAEGDVIVPDGGGYAVDKSLTDERRRKIKDLQDSLWG